MMKGILKGIILLTLVLMAVSAFAAIPEITQVSYNPSPAVPGTTITLLVQIENKDKVTQNGVTVQIENIYPFTVKTSDAEPNPRTVGDISAYGNALVTYTLYIDPTAENTTYELPITVLTKGDPTGKKTLYPIVISGKDPLVKVVSAPNDKLLPGEVKEISLEIQNIGTSTAYDILVELPEDRTITATGTVVERDITPLGAAEYVQSLMPGEIKTVNMKISVSPTATIKANSLPVSISYRNSTGVITTTTSTIGLNIYGNAILDATLKDQTGTLSNEQITLELFNKGPGKAEFILVTLDTNNGVITSPRQFIGTLGPNDVDTVKTGVVYTTAGDHTITATITYQDADSTPKTITINVPIKAQAATDTGTSPVLIIIIILVIVGLVWNFGFRAKNKKK